MNTTVKGCSKVVSLDRSMLEVGWESLGERRRKRKIILIYKIINGLASDYLSSLLPEPVAQNVSYELRNRTDIRLPKFRTDLYSRSFLPSALRDWNSLPANVRESPSLAAFKCHLNRNRPTSSKLYYYGDRRLQVLHTRLRTENSSLNHHLFSKNLIDSPLCRCGSIETTEHFLLQCTRYTHIRQLLIASVSAITTPCLHTLLYGDDSLDYNVNSIIFDLVHDFIFSTKRFD